MSIAVEQVAKSFRGSTVLEHLDLSVQEGEIVGIVGANSSGKSTLVRLLSGIFRPDRGTVKIGGIDLIRRPAEAKRAITAVYQEALFSQMSDPVRALRAYGSFYRPRLTAQDVQRVLLELGVREEDQRKPILMLSGGTKKKIEFAKCLLCDTAVYLFDEPFAGFDKESRAVGFAAIEELRARGKAILLCDHEKGAIELSDRVLELQAGRLLPKFIEGAKKKVRVQAEVKGWRQELKQILRELREIEEVAVRVAPLSSDDIALVLQKAGISPSGRPVKVIYADGDQGALAKLLGMGGATMQMIQSEGSEGASHVILTLTLAQQAEQGDLMWLREALSVHQVEVLSLEVMRA